MISYLLLKNMAEGERTYWFLIKPPHSRELSNENIDPDDFWKFCTLFNLRKKSPPERVR